MNKTCLSVLFGAAVLVSLGCMAQDTPSSASSGGVSGITQQTISPEEAARFKAQYGGTSQPNVAPDLNDPPVFGRDYGPLQHPIPNQDPDSNLIPVMVFFRYDMPSAAMLITLEEWKKTLSSDVQVNTSIASSGTEFENYSARVFFALTLMGKESTLRLPMMHAIQDQKLQINSPEELTNWLANQNVSSSEFQKTINSNEDISLSMGAVDTTNLYEVKVAPCVIIDGRFWIRPNLKMTPARFVKITDFVLNVVRQERAKAKQS